MTRKIIVSFFIAALLGAPAGTPASADNQSLEDRIKALEARVLQTEVLQDKIGRLEKENEALRSRVASLETAKPPAPVVDEKPKPGPAMLDKIGTKLKIKGRWGAGFLKSGQGGSSPQGSFEAPEAKVQLGFEPDKYNTIIVRASYNNAAFTAVDYFYVDSKNFLPQLEGTPFTLESRLGRFKLQYGEETWSNNIVESALVSNSAANAAVSDEGVQLSGKIFKDNPLNLKWYFAVTNGNSGTGSDNLTPKSYSGKLSMTPIAPLYLSASIYDSGSLKTGASELSMAGITTSPTSATRWDRSAWEVDARYDFEKGKVMDPPAYTDSKAYIRGAFGQYYDDASIVATGVDLDREANYGYVEGLWNFHPKWYGAYRYSVIDFLHDYRDTLNSAGDLSRYDRHAAAIGYRWTDKTIIKVAYDFNDADRAIGDPSDDLLSVVLVSSF